MQKIVKFNVNNGEVIDKQIRDYLDENNEETIVTLTPVSNEGDEAVVAVLEKSGGGSGGSDLPDVTASDNGKVLKVVDGVWDKADEKFVVSFEYDLNPITQTFTNVTADKTMAEIDEAVAAGKEVVAHFDNETIDVPMTGYTTETGAHFTTTQLLFDSILSTTCYILHLNDEDHCYGNMAAVRKDDFLVTYTRDITDFTTWTCDKTYSEISTAISNNKNVHAKLDFQNGVIQNMVFSTKMNTGSGYGISYSLTGALGGQGVLNQIIHMEDDTIIYEQHNFSLLN